MPGVAHLMPMIQVEGTFPDGTKLVTICVSLATALEEWLEPPQTVIMRGPERELSQWEKTFNASYRPDTLALAIPSAVRDLPATLAKPVPATGSGQGLVNAWVCRGVNCLPPIGDRGELERALAGDGAR